MGEEAFDEVIIPCEDGMVLRWSCCSTGMPARRSARPCGR